MSSNEGNEPKASQGGASLVEYALLVALVFVVCIGAVRFFGQKRDEKFNYVSSTIENETR